MYAPGVLGVPLLLGLATGAPPPSADPDLLRMAVAPLRGKGGAVCSRSLAEILGERVRIVPLDARVEGLTSWDELSAWIEQHGAAAADVVVVGSLGKRTIVLEAYATGKQKLLALGSIRTLARCRIGAQGRAALFDWLAKILNEPPPRAPPPSVERVPPPPPAKTEIDRDQAPAGASESAELERTARSIRQDAVELTATMSVGRRSFSLFGAMTPNLRQHEVDAMPVPALQLVAFPFVAGRGPLEHLQPLGLAADFSRAVGLSSSRTEGGPELDTVHTEVAARVFYRWPLPLESVQATVIPQIGYHHLMFALQGDPGESEPDLPDVGYSSLSFGVGVDVPVNERVTAFGAGTYLLVLDGGQIFEAGFFENGSAWGYRIELGLSYRIWEGLSARLVGHHLSYSLTLDPTPGASRVAESGQDAISGIGIGLSYAL